MLWLLLLACGPKTEEALSLNLPLPGPEPEFVPPAPVVRTLSNGVELWVVEDHQIPLVSLHMIFEGGAQLDPAGKAGLSVMTADLMDEAAGGKSAVELSKALRLLAADMGAMGTRESIELGLEVHAERLPEALALMADVALAPALSEEDWARVKDQHLNGLRQRSDDAGEVARYLAPYLYYGESHPLGRVVDGTLASAESVSLDDVRAAWARHVQPDKTAVIAAGDVQIDALAALIEAEFAAWPTPPEPLPAPSASAERPGAGKIWMVDSPGAAQTAIRVMVDGYKPGDAEEGAAKMANVVIGGSFTSRLNNLLREQKGYTYGASSSFVPRTGTSTWLVTTAVRADATADALRDLMGVLEGADAGFSEEEATKARAQLFSDAVAGAETRAALAGELTARARVSLPPDGVAAELSAARGADAAAMTAAAARYLDPSKMQVLLVGDAESVKPQLEKAGFAVEMVEEPK